MEKKGKSKTPDTPINHEESPHPDQERNKSRLRRRRRGGSSAPPDSGTGGVGRRDSQLDSDASLQDKKSSRRKKKQKKRRSSRATTTTGTTEESSEWSKKLSSRIAAERKKKEDKPKELSEKDLVEWMQRTVPYVEKNSPLWNKWTLASFYHFIRSSQTMICIALFDVDYEQDENVHKPNSVLYRLHKICKGPLITFNELIPEYQREFLYFVKVQPVALDGLNYEEVVSYGNVPMGSPDGQHPAQALNNLLVHYWSPILMKQEFLPVGLQDQVFMELNSVSCATQTTSHFLQEDTLNELLLYVPMEIQRTDGNPFEMARRKEFSSRLEETIIYWLRKIKQCLVLQELDDTDTWPGPSEEIQFWANRAKNLKNILNQMRTLAARRFLQILAISHSPYILELKSIMEQVSSSYNEASSNAHYLFPVSQPLENLKKCKLSEIPVEIQKFLWLVLTIWRNSPFYNTPTRLNGLLRKFSNALVVHCKGRIKVEEILQRRNNLQKTERLLRNCEKCLKWWRQIYGMTKAMYKKCNVETAWVFDESKIFVHVDALILRILDLVEILLVTRLYIRKDSLPLYPGIKGPYISKIMKNSERLLSSKLDELTQISDLVLNVKDTQWLEHMKSFRQTALTIDMFVQNCLEESFDQMSNLKQKLDLMKLFHRFYNKREVITRQIDKLSIKLYEYFEQEILRLRFLFERKVVPLPMTFTNMAGKGAWAYFMRRRIEVDLDMLKKAEIWMPKTSGIAFQNLVRNEAKSLADAISAYGNKCYQDWAKEFQLDGQGTKMDLRGRLEIPLLIRSGKGGGIVKLNLDRIVFRNLLEAEMFARLGKSVPPLMLMTVYPWRDKLHGLKENVGIVAKWYNKCVVGLSQDERLLFKDRLMPVEKKIYCCLAQQQWTWTSVRTADQQFVDEFKSVAVEIVENIGEYRIATRKVAEIIEKICDRRMVCIKGMGENGTRDVHMGDIYEVEEFKEEQNGRIENEMKKVAKGYREIGGILRDLFKKLFAVDGVEVKVQWGKYVTLVDSCIEEALIWSARKSLETVVQAITGDKPVFRVYMKLEDSEVKFEPELERLADTVLGVHRNMGKALEPLVKLQKFLGTGGKMGVGWSGGTAGGYADALLKDNECLEIERNLKFSIERCVSEVNLYAERWIPYRDIWEVDREEFMRNYEKQWPDMVAYEKDLKRYTEISEIVYGADSVVTIGWLQVDCTKLKEGISEESQEWFQVLTGDLYKKAKGNLLQAYNYMEEKRKALSKEPETLQEQLEIWKVAQDVRGEVRQKVFASFPAIKERFDLLRKYKFQLESNVEEMEINMERNWRKYLRFLRETDEKLEGSWGRLKKAFLGEARNFKGKVEELQRLWEREGPFSKEGSESTCELVLIQLENFGNDVKVLKKEETELVEALKTFKINQARNQILIDLEGDIGGLIQVWLLVKQWEANWLKWKGQKLRYIETEIIEEVSSQFLIKFLELNKKFEMKAWRAIAEMIDFINVIKGSLKSCTFLQQQTLKDRHWEWVKNLIKKENSSVELTDSPKDLTLDIVVQSKLHLLLGPISEITWSSEKEMAVEQTLEKIQDYWESENFQVQNLLKSEIPFEIGCSPGLQDTLMDHLVSLTAMKGSKYIATFQDTVDYWEECLQNVNSILGVLLDTQKEWILLDRVFSKEYVQRNMPGSARSFSVVTNVWASILVIVTQVRNVVRVLNETEDLLEMLNDLQEKFKSIQQEFDVWLDGLRQEFPRFWFVSNEELIKCVGGDFQDYVQVMKKVFGNFGNVQQYKLDETNQIVIQGILGVNGEKLEFVDELYVTGRPLESLFGELENSIKMSVKQNLSSCLQTFGGLAKLEDFLLSEASQWTEQSLQTAVKVQWTMDVGRAIRESGESDLAVEGRSEVGLKKVFKRLRRSVVKMTNALKEVDNCRDESKLKGVIVTLIYLRDVTEKLQARNCGDLESFEWLQYLRWYWNGDEITLLVKQGFATITYGWEYCGGGDGNVVITPLTEKCFLALTTAVGFQMGGYIHGGGKCNSGKHETLKELGRQLGKYVLNLTVGPNTEYGSLSGCITGIVLSGAWAVLKNVENCVPEVINMIVSKLGLLTKAKMEFHENIMLDGVETTLNRGCAIFAVIGAPWQLDSEAMSLTRLKSVLRPVSLIQPDVKNILDVRLFLGGFENWTVLSKKIENIFSSSVNIAKLCGRKYSFSLTGMLAVVERALELKMSYSKQLNENEAVVKALEFVIMPAFKDEEKYVFSDLVKSQFPAEEQVVSLKGEHLELENFIRESFQVLGYQHSEKIVKYCLRLYELVKAFKGVVIVGNTGCGKTVIRRLLLNALTMMYNHQKLSSEKDNILNDELKAVDDSFIKEYIFNLATIDGLKELFGTSNDDGKWKNGILTKILKSRTIMEEEESGLLWIVFDAPMEKCWVNEEIWDLCNGSDVITLAHCESIRVDIKNTTTFFEVDNLWEASPGLISKCGMLYIEDNYIGTFNPDLGTPVWSLYLNAWLTSLKDSNLKLELTEYLETVVEKSLNFRVEHCKPLISGVIPIQLVSMFVHLLKSFLNDNQIYKVMEQNGKSRFSIALKQITAFSLVWSIFAGLDDESQLKTNAFVKDLDPIQVFPAKRTVYDYFLQVEYQKWMKWEILGPLKDHEFDDHDFIETLDTVKAEYLVQRFTSRSSQVPVLLCGRTNSGKSKFMQSLQKLSNEQSITLQLQVTPKMTARSVQTLIKTQLEPVSSFALAPSAGKNLTVLIDDLNAGPATLSSSCSYGEFLRFLIEYWMWYDIGTGALIAISNVNIIAAMQILNSHNDTIPTRLQRKFSLVYLPEPDEFKLRRIFTTKAKWKLNHFAPPVKLLADEITLATLDIYKLISTEFVSNVSSSDPFQCFSIHDIGRVYEGLFRAHKESQDTKLGIIRLWFNECTRIFYDRLQDQNSQKIVRDILEKQLYMHFDLSVGSLFLSDRNNGNTTRGIFGTFMNNYKRYEEIKNEKQLYRVIEDHLRRNVIKNGRPVIVFRNMLKEVAKIARVISQRKGHLLIYGEEGHGRETLSLTAASLYKYKVFKCPDSTDKEIRKALKTAYCTCAVENVGCCLILKDEQVNDLQLEWISLATSTVDIPGLFTKKEVRDIYKKISSVGNGVGGKDAVTWFKDRVKNNFHLILCVQQSNQELLCNLSQCYPSLLKRLTVCWFDIWTKDAYLEVAYNLINSGDTKDDKMTDQSVSSMEIFSTIHAIALAEEPIKLVTLMHFVDFMEFYKWYLKSTTEEIQRKMTMFRNAIQEITGVRAKIGNLTEQAEAAERKVEASRIECEKKLEIIHKQESDTKAQEILVKQLNGQLEEEIKEYEELAKVIKEEWSDALGEFEKSTELLQDLSEEDLTHIRSYYSPPPLVSRVLDAVMIMLERELNWPEAKIQLGHPGFIKSITEYDKDRITLDKLNNLKKFLQSKEFTPEAVSKYSNGARILCTWIHAIEKYGRCYLSKIAPKREKLENSEQSILEHKQVLMLSSDKLQLLKENLSEIQAVYETKLQLKESLEDDARKCDDVLGRAKSVLKLLEDIENESEESFNHVKMWKEKLMELDTRLYRLEADALVCSASLAYLGSFDKNVREKMKERWIMEVENYSDIKISNEKWDLENALTFCGSSAKERLQACLKFGYSSGHGTRELEYDWFMENILIAKKARRPLLFRDPHDIHVKNGQVVIEVNSLSKIMSGYKLESELLNESEDGEKIVYLIKDNYLNIGREITSRFSVVDFTFSRDGLIKYFTRKITQLISPKEGTKRQTLMRTAFAEKSTIADLKNNIPKLVISCGGSSMLNNGDFPDTLSKWQSQIEESKSKLFQIETEIEAMELSQKESFSSIASLFTRIFQTINEMAVMCPSYEISLEFFTGLIEKLFYDEFSFHNSESQEENEETIPQKKDTKMKMKTFLGQCATLKLYNHINKSMFETHRFQFTLLLCIKTLLDKCSDPSTKYQLKQEITFLSKNYENREHNSENSVIDWLTSNQLMKLKNLDKLHSFQGLYQSICELNTDQWKVWTKDQPTPENSIPQPFGSNLNIFQTLLIISILRPNCVKSQILKLVTEVLGQEYANCLSYANLTDIQEIYDTFKSLPATVISTVPIIFLLDNDGTRRFIPDPQPSILALSKSLKPPQKLYTLSFSISSNKLCHKLIEQGINKGFWIYLANCHLCPEEWLRNIEELLKQRRTHRNFKLWLSVSSDFSLFPKDIIRNSVKVSVESPSTFSLRMARLNQKMSITSQHNTFSSEQGQRLMYGLCYMHCQLTGWNQVDEHTSEPNFPTFQDIDFEVALAILKIFVQKISSEDPKQQHFPWWAVKYMLELQYSNHAFSEAHQQLIQDILSKIFSVEKNNIDIDFVKEQCGVGNKDVEILRQEPINQTNSNEIIECCKLKKILSDMVN